MRTDANQERRNALILPAAAPIDRRQDRARLPVTMLRQSKADRLAKAHYLLAIEARGELDLA
ncbi:hypothetical protein NKG95_33725 [Mesorhizobium sp. M1423]|uniref:hypothetical protein n=1 Tax=Mesorhizobium sp. M1423 TaxID=2957101 RepID=UPI00333D6987